MKAYERLMTAISGGTPHRVPNVPKIWVDLGAQLTGTDLIEVVKDPGKALRVIVEAGKMVGADGVRQFHFPERLIEGDGETMYELREGRRIGRIDMLGGLATHLFDRGDFHLEDPWMMAFYHFWAAKEPFVEDLGDVKRIVVPPKEFYEEIGCGERQREILHLIDDSMALIGDCSSATLAFVVSMLGYERALLSLVDDPSLVHALMERGAEIAIEKGKFNVDIGLKVLRLNDSVANMSVISPEHWRSFIFPYMKRVCDELHSYDGDVRIYCHICGNILPVLDLLIETGLDCIGPLDPLGGISCSLVRERVGDSVSLMGGVDTLSFIYKEAEEILQEAKECIYGAGLDGGYILGSGCVIPRDAKRENLEALAIATHHYGLYPLREEERE